jgi:hypothetical protein
MRLLARVTRRISLNQAVRACQTYHECVAGPDLGTDLGRVPFYVVARCNAGGAAEPRRLL